MIKILKKVTGNATANNGSIEAYSGCIYDGSKTELVVSNGTESCYSNTSFVTVTTK